jgi:hypothetical protein
MIMILRSVTLMPTIFEELYEKKIMQLIKLFIR